MPVPSLPPGHVFDVSVQMTSPNDVGCYSSSWRLAYVNSGIPITFGDEIWVVITVAEGGALGVTQALFATSFQRQPDDDDNGDVETEHGMDAADEQEQRPSGPQFGMPVFGANAVRVVATGQFDV